MSKVMKDGYARIKIKELQQQSGDIANYVDNDFCFGLHLLRKYLNTPTPQIVIWGDSIVDGTGSHGNDSWVEQFKNALHCFYGVKGNGFYSHAANANWTFTGKGITHTEKTNSGGDIDFTLTGASGLLARGQTTVDIFYNTHPDGGTFKVFSGATQLAAGTCQGEDSYGKKLTVTINAQAGLLIRPDAGQKVYINAINETWTGKTGGQVHRIAYGGHGFNTYTDAEIAATLSLYPAADLVIIENGANDYSPTEATITLAEYTRKLRLAIETAKANGSDVILMVAEQSQLMEQNAADYKRWVDVKKALAIEYGCGFIDIGTLWGGFTKGNTDGLYSDGIHPSQKGHDVIAFAMCHLLLPGYVRYYDEKAFDNQNVTNAQAFIGITGGDIYTVDWISKLRNYIWRGKQYFADSVYIKVASAYAEIDGNVFGNTAQRPATPKLYMRYFDTQLQKPIWCVQVSPAIWKDAAGNVV